MHSFNIGTTICCLVITFLQTNCIPSCLQSVSQSVSYSPYLCCFLLHGSCQSKSHKATTVNSSCFIMCSRGRLMSMSMSLSSSQSLSAHYFHRVLISPVFFTPFFLTFFCLGSSIAIIRYKFVLFSLAFRLFRTQEVSGTEAGWYCQLKGSSLTTVLVNNIYQVHNKKHFIARAILSLFLCCY